MRAYSSARLERFPDKEEVDGSSPSRPTPLSNGDLAQLVEHRLCKAGVRGSIPLVSTQCILRDCFAVNEPVKQMAGFLLPATDWIST